MLAWTVTVVPVIVYPRWITLPAVYLSWFVAQLLLLTLRHAFLRFSGEASAACRVEISEARDAPHAPKTPLEPTGEHTRSRLHLVRVSSLRDALAQGSVEAVRRDLFSPTSSLLERNMDTDATRFGLVSYRQERVQPDDGCTLDADALLSIVEVSLQNLNACSRHHCSGPTHAALARACRRWRAPRTLITCGSTPGAIAWRGLTTTPISARPSRRWLPTPWL